MVKMKICESARAVTEFINKIGRENFIFMFKEHDGLLYTYTYSVWYDDKPLIPETCKYSAIQPSWDGY